MVSEFGHLRYLYPLSRLKLLPLLTVKLVSSPKLKKPVLVRLRTNDRTTLRSSVHFWTHFFVTNSPVPHVRRIQILGIPPRTTAPSASTWLYVRPSVPSPFCAYLFANRFREYITYSVPSYLLPSQLPVIPVLIAIIGSHPSLVWDVPFARTSVPSKYQPCLILHSAARTSTS